MRTSPFACALVALAVSACSEDTADAVPAPAAAPEAAATPAAPAQDGPIVALDTEGLRLVDAASGSTRLIAFGQPMDQTISAVGAAQGGAPGDRGENGECGAGPLAYASWNNGLTLWFQDGAFGGWAANGAGPTTMDGIGVGSTRAQLEASGTEVVMQDSTLGAEFAAGDLYGLLDSPQGSVTNLWAGVSCNFR